jgi:hypothetical protein
VSKGWWFGVEPLLCVVCVAPVGVELGCLVCIRVAVKNLLWFLYWNRGENPFLSKKKDVGFFSGEGMDSSRSI